MNFNLNTIVPYIKVDIDGENSDLCIVMSSVNTLDAWSVRIDPKTKTEWNPVSSIEECAKIGRDTFSFYGYALFVTFTTSFRENFKYLNEINLKYVEEEKRFHSLYEFYHSNVYEAPNTDEYMGSFNKDFFNPPVNPMDKKGGLR